uniref:Uncharacterized protein n=1 Tax=Arion vulgaris TaxID=1028688 RepID=A0A0B6Y6U0_9EUPU
MLKKRHGFVSSNNKLSMIVSNDGNNITNVECFQWWHTRGDMMTVSMYIY